MEIVRENEMARDKCLFELCFPRLSQCGRLPILDIRNESKQVTFSLPIQIQTCHWCGICLENP